MAYKVGVPWGCCLDTRQHFKTFIRKIDFLMFKTLLIASFFFLPCVKPWVWTRYKQRFILCWFFVLVWSRGVVGKKCLAGFWKVGKNCLVRRRPGVSFSSLLVNINILLSFSSLLANLVLCSFILSISLLIRLYILFSLLVSFAVIIFCFICFYLFL